MSPTLLEHYSASMVLSGVGDAFGYDNGNWEFCNSGLEIHRQVEERGGVEKLNVRSKY